MMSCHWAVGALVAVCACSNSVDAEPQATSERVRWNVALPRELETIAALTPALATQDFAVFAAGGRAIAFEAATGIVRWELVDSTFYSIEVGTFFAASPNVVAVYPGLALGVDAASGAVRWRRSGMPAGKRGAFSTALGEAFYGGGVNELGTALSLASGSSRSFPLRQPGDSTSRTSNLLVSGDTLYSSIYRESRTNSLVGQLWLGRYERTTGRPLEFLRFPTDSTAPNSTIALSGDNTFFSDADRNEVWAWNRFTGEARRIHKVQGGLGNIASVQVSGDTLVVPAANLTMYVYSISRAALLFTVPTRSSLTAVAICGDVIYMQHSVIEAVSRTTGRSLGVVLAPGTIRMSAFTKGPDYVFGYTPTRAYALRCPP